MTTIQLVSSAQLGRKQRINDFKEYVEANRQTKKVKQIVAEYSIQTGLSPRLVKGYLQIFYDAGFYIEPRHLTDWLIVTPKEYKKLVTDHERKEKEESKRLEHELDYGIN